MTGEQQLRWTGFIAASFAVHAAALAWVDFGGADLDRLPSKLTVLIKSSGEGEVTERSEAPASASRNRDLFARTPARAVEAATVKTAEALPEPTGPELQPEHQAEIKSEPQAKPLDRQKVAKTEKRESPPAEKIATPPSRTVVATTDPAPQAIGDRAPAEAAADQAAAASASEVSADQSGGDNAGRRGELLSLLHEAISRQKRYPLLAVRQRREGTATVSFSLSPSGEMDAIGVDRSSGFTVLDTAAVSAVSRVAPFAPARIFLSDVTRFKVDVTFKLH